MGASVIDSIERALHIKESNLLVTNLDHLPLTGNNLISLRYLHKTCHNSPPIKFLLERLNLHSIRLTFSLPGIHGVIKRDQVCCWLLDSGGQSSECSRPLFFF